MKAPTARKLPSGSWFVRVRVNGEDVSITKPTEKEAIAEAMAVKAGLRENARVEGKDKTVKAAMDEYIKVREGVISPSTIRGYKIVQRNAFQSVMQTKIGSISDVKWQSLVSLEAKKHKGKTVANYWGFMSAVIKASTGRKVEVKLPQVIPNERAFLDDTQIKVFIEAIKGLPVEIPALLALSGLRDSELKALRWEEDIDLEAGVLHVNGATVPDENNKYIRKKETKNSTSRRTVPIIAPLQAALEAVEDKTGLVVPTGQRRTYYRVNAVCKANGLPEVGVHGLRHSFASLNAYLKVSEEETMKIGGWKRRETMHKIYEHTYQKTKENYGTAFTGFFEKSESGNENGNEK